MYVQSMSLEMTIVSCIVTNIDGHTKGLVVIYSGSTVIHKICMADPVTCIVFGKFGQEENALLMISSSKKLHLRQIMHNFSNNCYNLGNKFTYTLFALNFNLI